MEEQPNLPWSAEDTEIAKSMWAQGHKASYIAAHLNKTRNSVIGKLHRIKTPLRAKPSLAIKRATTDQSAIRIKNAKFVAIMPASSQTFPRETLPQQQKYLMLQLPDLENEHCRWPFGDPKQPGFGFCGCARISGSSYCAEHANASLPKSKQRSIYTNV